MKRGNKIVRMLLTGLVVLSVSACSFRKPKESVVEDFTIETGSDGVTITGYEGKAQIIHIPKQIGGKNVTVIGTSAFADKGEIKEVIMPDTVVTIENNAFHRCTLTKVKLSSNLKTIGGGAFWSSALEEMSLPGTVTYIGSYAFADTKITEVTLPSSLESIGESAFAFAPIEEVTIPSSVKAIHSHAFQKCGQLTTVVVEEGVKSIGKNAFSDCPLLKSVTLPSSLEQFGKEMFAGSPDVLVKAAAGTMAEQYCVDNQYKIAE